MSGITSAQDRTDQRPNLVFVVPDEYRKQAIGFWGDDPVITPNLDEFAGESCVLTDAVCAAPVCSPYRGMLMTGRYNHWTGLPTNCNTGESAADVYLRRDDRCFSDVLHDAGYSLGYIGKWHLDKPREPYVEPPRADGKVWDEYTPTEGRHGFDFWYSYGCYDGHMTPHYWTNDTPRDEPLQFREWSPIVETNVACDYIANANGERDPNNPFALVVAMNPPHMPFSHVPDEYKEMYGDKGWEELLTRPNVDRSLDEGMTKRAKNSVRDYFAMVTGVDDQFGRIMAALDAQGLKDNTIVVFTSDHGEMMGSHNRMHKNVWYEESMSIPFIIRWPGRIAPRRDDLLLNVPDTMPTLLEMMGCLDAVPEGVHGTSYARALMGQEQARPESTPYLMFKPGGVRTHRYTFVKRDRNDRDPMVVLYDNQEDPYQMKNVAEERPETVTELTGELNGWLEKLGADWRA